MKHVSVTSMDLGTAVVMATVTTVMSFQSVIMAVLTKTVNT